MSITTALFRDFRADGPVETAILERLKRFLVRYGEAGLGSEIAGEIGHITAGAWIESRDAQVLLVFGRKSDAWRLPGAHCEGNWLATARNEAARALGRAPATQNPVLWALSEREVAEYWNTPAHRHFELIFCFEESETRVLPRGARWFSREEIALLGDATFTRLLQRDSIPSG